ncbi:MAG: nucleotidyltransferase family protein [bacterium]|nr:nucleotidyltransferase family protein [bacterium]MDZ4285459.1 nucleotidyltransferase family protein [Candidatus Sungbacteria bacterium]
MKTLILAGGFGTRLAHISEGKPKPLMEVAGKPMLERQINFLLSHGMDDIRLSLHHKADQIIEFCEKRWPGKFEYAVEPTPLGTGGGIRFATKDWKEPFLVVNGDILSDINVRAFVARAPNSIVGAYQEDARAFGLLDIKEGKVSAFLEKPKELQGGYINAGFYFLHPNVFSEIVTEKFMMEFDIFPQLAKAGKLNVFMHDGYWIDCGTEERLMQAHSHHANL